MSLIFIANPYCESEKNKGKQESILCKTGDVRQVEEKRKEGH